MVKTYDPKKVLISLGTHQVSGYSDGTFISIEANGDGITKKVGCDGEIIRSIDPDGSAKVTMTVQQTSPTVAVAQQLYDRDKKTADGMFPILVKDLMGGLLFSAEQAWTTRPPSREFAKESTDRQIEIDCGEATWEGEE